MTGKENGKRNVLKTILISLLALALVFSTVSTLFIKNFYDQYFSRYDSKPYTGYLRFSDTDAAYERTTVQFPSGKNTLTGYFYGNGSQKGLVVIAAGRGSGAEDYLAETIYFVDHGWRVFAFDYTGSYASEGKSMVGLAQSRLDLRAALAYLQSSGAAQGLPVMLYGHSWGAYAVTAVLNDTHNVDAVVSISGFNAPMGLLAEQAKAQMGVLGAIEYPFGWLYQTLLFGKDAWVTAVNGINSSDIPVMIIHGDADESIAYDGASIIARRGEITNPQVVYKTRSAEKQNDHDHLFKSQAAIAYTNEKNQEFQALRTRYDNNVPDSEVAAFYASIDPYQTSELDADFMNEVNQFFESALVD